jgi:Immunoglobulin-like domain of bacterial spore germination
MRRLILPVLLLAALAGCGGSGKRDVCSNKDDALTNAAFVFVETPVSGQRVSPGFDVSGCSSTFESTVSWRLEAKDGHALANGTAQGGSQEPGPYDFTVAYSVPAVEIGRLVVSAPRVTSEGFPPVRNVIPLVLGT